MMLENNNQRGYPAKYYRVKDDLVICELCPHRCHLTRGERGRCRARKNQGGELFSLNYGEVSSLALDPIEKKPLYHFYPGSETLSLGTWGCNLACDFCQNWRISQGDPPVREYQPGKIIDLCWEAGSEIISFTYSEPLVWYEFVRETAELARKEGYKTVLVSNGFVNQRPLEELIPFISACNIDLKSFQDDFYQRLCQGRAGPVKQNLRRINDSGVHLEVTSLLVTGENSSPEDIRELADFLARLNPDIPLHLSRYRPAYKSKRPATDLRAMEEANEIASSYLNYVYLGNIVGPGGRDTSCPECGSLVIKRRGFSGRSRLEQGRCPECGQEIAGKF